MIAAALLAVILTAAPQTHVWNVTDGIAAVYVTHSELPAWALPGDGPLWHWHDSTRGWRQLRGTKHRTRRTVRHCVT